MASIDAIINRQLLKWELQRQQSQEQPTARPTPLLIVTVSRQKGSRGSYFASRLAERLGYQRLHREVIDTICETSGYRKRVIESIDDKFRGELALMVESMVTGQTVDHADYFRHLYNVVLSMSRLGGVVLVGRGGNFILGPRRGFHIRFIAPREKRIENLVNYNEVAPDEAGKIIDSSDADRREFIKKLFNADIDNPHHYDIVLNAAYMDVEEMLDVAIRAINGKFDKLAYMHHS